MITKNSNTSRHGSVLGLALALSTIGGLTSSAGPFNTQPPFVAPVPGSLIPVPTDVPGKEYSNYLDREGFPSHLPNAGQVILWDGVGGTQNTTDFPMVDEPQEVDALANLGDALFSEVIDNRAALLFSLKGLNEIQYEDVAGGMGVWATPPEIDQLDPDDVDGLEVWGPVGIPLPELEERENGFPGADVGDDANRYSLEGDPGLPAVSVFDSNGNPVFLRNDIAQSIGLDDQSWDAVDVDAVMTWTSRIVFSLAPIPDAVFQDGLIQTISGGEIWTWDGIASSPANFLDHGGHLWDFEFGAQIGDVNALEAVSVPEPTTGALLVLPAGLLIATIRRRRR